MNQGTISALYLHAMINWAHKENLWRELITVVCVWCGFSVLGIDFPHLDFSTLGQVR